MEATTQTTQSIRRIAEIIILFNIQTPTAGDYFYRILRVRRAISNLQKEFESLQGFLVDAEKRQEQDSNVRKWMSSIKDLASEAQDITEKHLNPIKRHRRRTQRRRGCGGYNPWHAVLSINDALILARDASKIYSLTNKISRLTSKMKAYGIEFTPLEEESSPPATGDGVEPLPKENQSVVIGLDDDVKEIENQLICTGSARVIGICGAKGLGKSTLVKEVLRRSTLVKEHFDAIFCFYCNGSEFEAGDVMKVILLYLLGNVGDDDVTDEEKNTIAGLEGDEMVCEIVSQILIEKKCLLVLDDLQSSARWDDTFRPAFSSIFLPAAAGSKIVVTTCDASVVTSVDRQAYLHQPRALTNEQKWLLFQANIAFLGQGIRGKAVKSIGKRILNGRIIGVPISIQVLAGILSYDTTYILPDVYLVAYINALYWLILIIALTNPIVLSVILVSLIGRRRRRRRFRRKNGQTLEPLLFPGHKNEIGVHQVLELSYNALPRRRLRLCLVQMSNHCGSRRISTEELFRVWIDQGIVKRGRRSSKVAESYLDELVKRSLVQVVEKDRITGKIKSCQLHSLVRDFYRQISNGSVIP